MKTAKIVPAKGSLGFVLWELEAETIMHNKMKP
jgi:hypothetical protein